MPRIQQLSAAVVNKIAAGEVIERPASVVKELLENSVDALATRIEVEVAAGGSELIRIVDDGEGVHPDDALLTISSHATSKIRTADDLFSVHTMGFRGEALASIAEVSQFSLRSRQPEAAQGFELEVNAGKLSPPRPCGCPAGTAIEVRNLFCNTPVRRKFLKTHATELGHITEQFTRIALANPRLHMVLRHNRKAIYELPATDRLSDRLQLFYGASLAEKLIWVESEQDGVRLWGYVAHPSQNKATAKGQYLFLNGRWIQDRSLNHALREAYRGLLMVGRYPVTYLFLEVPAEGVDVNVHPTKSEVRFRDSQVLYRQLLSTLRTKFLSVDLDGHLSMPTNASQAQAPPEKQVTPEVRAQAQQELVAWAGEQIESWKTVGPDGQWEPPPPTVPRLPQGDDIAERASSTAELPALGQTARTDPPHTAPSTGINGDAPPRAMQVHDSYLVVETNDGITVIDQHALHERIMYEQLRDRVLENTVESQRLLLPETIELSAGEASLLVENAELLGQFGLGIESFGGGTVLLNRYPLMLAKANLRQLVLDIADQLAGSGEKPTRRDLIDELLHMMSCKAAVKAGDRLNPEEIDSLLAQRHLVDDAHHCPHGRPTALVLSRADLDRQFGRMG